MNTAVLSVVYPGLEPFLPDFVSSLSGQTDGEFSLYLVNDEFRRLDSFLADACLDYKVRKASGTPASLRKLGIQWILEEGVEAAIFADADDTFSDNRVEISKKLLEQHDVIFNELVLFGKNIATPFPLLERRYHEGQSVTAESLQSFNCIGMSNSAANTNIAFKLHQIPDSIIPFDWALFSLVALSGSDIVFTNEIRTYYRQHENNLASPLDLSDRRIVDGVRMKREHFRFLAQLYAEYDKLASTFDDLYDRLLSDASLKQKYLLEVRNQSPEYPLWWEPIKTLEELGL